MTTRGLKEAMSRHPDLTARPVTIRDLQRRFQPSPPGSLKALRIKMGPFKPETDAFRFNNNFPITDENARQLRQRYQTVMDAIVGEGVRQVANALSAISLNPLPIGPSISLPGIIVDEVIGKVTTALAGNLLDKIIGAIPGSFGRCGGMAFAGYDFYLLDWTVDERLGTTPPATGVLGDYIFSRLLDSLDLNAGTFLSWVMTLHVMPVISKVATAALLAAAGSFGGPIGSAIGALIGSQEDFFRLGGPGHTLNNTRDEWRKIKSQLDGEAAWPIGLIFGDNASPFAQHQVLAIGYTDNGDNTGSLTIWDNNDANERRTLGLDFRGHELQATNCLEGPLKGVFLEAYSSHQPPLSLKLS